jgi:flagellin
MTRINTNVSSLVAQQRLQRSNNDLNLALTRLSTGLRINNGKDDPAGLIASENLRSDITSVSAAITNTQRANQVIATADSALNQISSLLNDVRGLVTEAANTGVLSAEQIAANQLQVDSSLEAINRIAQTTSFQGRKLLDGSLDFIINATPATVEDLQIQQANLGTAGSLAVSVDITAAATQATLTQTIPATAAAVAASYVITFADTSTITVTAATAGAAANGTTIELVNDTSVTAGQAVAFYDSANNNLEVHLNGDTADNVIEAAIDGLAEFTAVDGATGTGFVAANDGYGVEGTLTGGSDAVNGIAADVVFQLSGAAGSEVFSFDTGATATQIRDAINLVSDATGVSASFAGTTLTLTSTAYGSDAFVDLAIISQGGGGPFVEGRDTGSDIQANVNGATATGKGNTISLNTAVLDLSVTVTEGSSTDLSFTITGGGALFQLGPDVVSNQQARIGIQDVTTGRLGGVSGRLYELADGGTKSLANDATGAFQVVEEAITQLTSLRGRLGAFQKTTLESNIVSLGDTLANLTEAQSDIRDADFAAESARLTRAQILVQAGTSVLAIANTNPQNALALLR